MFAIKDLRNGLFIMKYPEPDYTQDMMKRQHPITAKNNPEAVCALVRIDDKSGNQVWQSDVIIGPKGGAAEIVQPMDGPFTLDIPKAVKAVLDVLPAQQWKLQTKLKQDLADLHRGVARQAAEIQNRFDKARVELNKQSAKQIMDLLNKKQSITKPMITKAGYTPDGKWLEQGTIFK